MCIRYRFERTPGARYSVGIYLLGQDKYDAALLEFARARAEAVSYTHLRANETVLDLVCRLLLEQKNKPKTHRDKMTITTYNQASHLLI